MMAPHSKLVLVHFADPDWESPRPASRRLTAQRAAAVARALEEIDALAPLPARPLFRGAGAPATDRLREGSAPPHRAA